MSGMPAAPVARVGGRAGRGRAGCAASRSGASWRSGRGRRPAARSFAGSCEAVGLGAHHPRDGAELDPAREQLRRQLRASPSAKKPPMSEPQRLTPESPIVSALVDRRAQAVEAPGGGRVAAPDDLARSGAAPVQPERMKRASGRARRRANARRRRSGSGAGRGCASRCPVVPSAERRVERRVLAEVLHPAVVAVVDRLAEQARRRSPRPAGRVKSNWRRPGTRVGAVAVDVGLARPRSRSARPAAAPRRRRGW